jgi:HEAT repeat protein
MLARAIDVVAAEWQEAGEDLRTFIVDTLFRLDGDKTIGFLDTLMEDPDPWLRMHLIELLAAIGDRRVPAFVNRFLDDEDEMVREVAGTTLQSLLPAVSGQIMNIQGM